jgi:hypothetical protein
MGFMRSATDIIHLNNLSASSYILVSFTRKENKINDYLDSLLDLIDDDDGKASGEALIGLLCEATRFRL